MFSLPVAITVLFKVLAVQGITSYNIRDLCTPTSTPTIHLRSETTLLTVPASLTLTRQCDVKITWDDVNMEIDLTSNPFNITGLPCNWISAVLWAAPYTYRAYACPSNPTGMDYILWPSKDRDLFTISVNATTGLKDRTRDLVLIVTPHYDSCKGTEYDDHAQNIGVCCNHGENETVEDFTECYEYGGYFDCIHKSMLCDGVNNCAMKNDEEDCPASGVVVGGGGVVWWAFGVVVWEVMGGWW